MLSPPTPLCEVMVVWYHHALIFVKECPAKLCKAEVYVHVAGSFSSWNEFIFCDFICPVSVMN